MQIHRYIEDDILKKIKTFNKIIIIYGSRQVGKTTLCSSIIKKLDYKTLFVDADEFKFNDVLASRDSVKIANLIEGYELLFIDEAQRIENIGLNLKIIFDTFKKIKVIATGSSSFELANKISEPLTGRKWTYKLFPISFLELSSIFNKFELDSQLEERLIYGSYPEIFSIKGFENKKTYLIELAFDYLYKDFFNLNEIRNQNVIRDLLKLLAFQVGHEVSFNELSRSLGISKETVIRYIDLLEKSFIIFSLAGFGKNLRKEVTRTNKYYFYDLGVRNALIDNFKLLNDRVDVGQIWENFLIVERMKKNYYKKNLSSSYFWRLYTGAEIDYIEQSEGMLSGFEFKFSNSKAKMPQSWADEYKNSSWQLINRSNYLDFIL